MSVLLHSYDAKDPYLRRVQAVFDPFFFDRNYTKLTPLEDKARHIRMHIGQIGLKLVDLKRDSQANDAQPDTSLLAHQLVPDLAICRTQLANTLKIDLARRVKLFNVEPTPIALAEAIELVAHAGGILDERYEQLERGQASNFASWDKIAREAVPELHLAASGLALEFQLGGLRELHAARLDLLRLQPGLRG